VDPNLPIGVFDSGVGGLTVLRALRKRLPNESLIYLGDTARVPYGTKSVESITRYATQATDHLVTRGIKLLVIACNTASAVSLDPVRDRFSPLPVVGVVEPGAAAAVAASAHQRHLVLATESTVKRHAYARAIHALAPDAVVDEVPASLLVALAEEGWTDGPIAESIARAYLAPALEPRESASQKFEVQSSKFAPRQARGDVSRSNVEVRNAPDTIVLGCTHFPLLEHAIRAAVGPTVTIVDSATTTAERVATLLDEQHLRRTAAEPPTLTLLATDGAERFARVGARFLGEAIKASDIEIVDL
jgi:glutamate racemase